MGVAWFWALLRMRFLKLMTNHPGDRHVLAAAVTIKADVIVTSNLMHFQEKDLVFWGKTILWFWCYNILAEREVVNPEPELSSDPIISLQQRIRDKLLSL